MFVILVFFGTTFSIHCTKPAIEEGELIEKNLALLCFTIEARENN